MFCSWLAGSDNGTEETAGWQECTRRTWEFGNAVVDLREVKGEGSDDESGDGREFGS